MNETIHPLERRAQALAEITKMQEELIASNQRIAELERQLSDQQTMMQREINRQQARAEVAEEERAKYRAESHIYRGKMIELATSMSNVGKLVREAEKIAATANALRTGETVQEAEAEQQEAAAIVSSLPQRSPQSQEELERELSEILGSARGHAVEETVLVTR